MELDIRRAVEQAVDEALELVVVLQIVGLVFRSAELYQEAHTVLTCASEF